MKTGDFIQDAVRLYQESRNAATYAGLLAVDSLLEREDAEVLRYDNDWLISTGNGMAIRVPREAVKPVVAKILDRMTTSEAKTYRLPSVDRSWDKALQRAVAEHLRSLPPPTSARKYSHLLQSVEDLVV